MESPTQTEGLQPPPPRRSRGPLHQNRTGLSVLLEGRLKGIQAFPESFFVDSEGNVVSEPYVGAMPKNHWRVTMKNEIEKSAQKGSEE